MSHYLSSYKASHNKHKQFARQKSYIAPVKDYHFDDYDGFVKFALASDFDARTSAMASYDRMVEELRKDGLEESFAAELKALKARLDMDKETFLRLKQDEITPLIEQEIVSRYYFQGAAVQMNLRYDTVLREALKSPRISY